MQSSRPVALPLRPFGPGAGVPLYWGQLATPATPPALPLPPLPVAEPADGGQPEEGKAKAKAPAGATDVPVVPHKLADSDDEEEEDAAPAEDVDGLEDAEGEDPVQKEEAELDTAQFAAAFEAWAGGGGGVTVDRLPALLVAAGAPGTDVEIAAAVGRVVGVGADPLWEVPYDRALEVYRRLVMAEGDTDVGSTSSRELGSVERWAASLSDARATNVLLTIVVGVSFTASFLVAGLAVLFMWLEIFRTLGVQMLEDLGLVQDVLDVFNQEIYVGEVQNNALDISTLVAMVTTYVSYNAVLLTDQKNLVYMAAFLAQGVAAWWEYQPDKAYINIARVMGIWADEVMTAEGRQEAFDIASNVVEQLPAGYEILLGQWTNASNTSYEYVTRLRYQDQCVNSSCNDSTPIQTFSPMRAALEGSEGALETLDYRSHPVFMAFTSIAGIGVEYKCDVDVIDASKYTRLVQYFDLQNANALDSREFLIGRIDANGNAQLLTQLQACDASCVTFTLRPDGPMGLALQNRVGVLEAPGYTGETLIAAYCPIPSANLGLVVQMKKNDRVAAILQSVAAMLDTINANLLTGSEELEMVVRSTANGTQTLTHLTEYKFATECPPAGCANVTEYWTIPMNNCSSGSVRTTDYRGKAVYAGYVCMPDFDAFLAMKVDEAQVDSDMIGFVIRYINERNALDNGTSYEFLAAQAKANLVNTDVQSFDDIQLLSSIKNPETCVRADCQWDSHSLLRAVQGRAGEVPGLLDDVNYANRPVMAAVEYDSMIGGGLGLVLEMDYEDFVAPILNTILIIMCFTLGVTVAATCVLVILTKVMMHSLIKASIEGKVAVEKEKEGFHNLVASMYPKYVVPRLLAGERRIVGHIKHTAVFFSDIYEFTAASNTITSEELIQFMGYTYGVMDDIADHYGVYKVKTVGDAYLAIAGLPRVEAGTVAGSKECCLDMLKFAATVAEVFSHRFFHPDRGDIMAVVANTMPWTRRGKKAAPSSKATPHDRRNKASVAPTGSVTESRNAWTTPQAGAETASAQHSVISGTSNTRTADVGGAGRYIGQMQCLMSYGIAAGPVTAGVLQGKSPVFDIWGKTVNLASRMETTGQPGRIQVSEHVFRRVTAMAGQPFAFEPGHKAYCKGFGAVNSYYVRSTSEPPPKPLMLRLGLEPRYGLFFFDNVVSGMQRKGLSATGPASGAVAGGEDAVSLSSAPSTGPANPAVNAPADGGLDMLDCEDRVSSVC